MLHMPSGANSLCVCVCKLCYVLDALLSPYVLLPTSVTDTNGDNDSVSDNVSAGCIVMSLFLHYFFLAQLTAIVVQVIH